MMLIAGLGNPGEKFNNTPHNMGFEALDVFAKENNFPEFEVSQKYNATISEGKIEGEKVTLLKPQTFMNESGKAIKKIVAMNKNAEVIVLHDDIDIPLGNLKIVKNRGSAGHKGVESIIKSIGNKNLVRIRLGIQPNAKKPKKPEQFVLKKFGPAEQKLAHQAWKKSAGALISLIEQGFDKTLNEYNRSDTRNTKRK